MKKLITLLAALAIATPLYAQPVPPPAAQASVMTEGVVRKVDRAAGKLTLRHGPIRNLDMPAMTMVFRIAQGQLLDGLNAGDRVRFEADRIEGIYTVTRIERLP